MSERASAERHETIALELREHNIGTSIPAGCRIEGRMTSPYGIIIVGEFIGELLCEQGSIVVAAGGKFRGTAEAERIYVEGDITSVRDGKRSILIGRMLIAGSSTAKINADLYSATFALHKAKVYGTLSPIERLRQARPPALEGSAEADLRSQRAAP